MASLHVWELVDTTMSGRLGKAGTADWSVYMWPLRLRDLRASGFLGGDLGTPGQVGNGRLLVTRLWESWGSLLPHPVGQVDPKDRLELDSTLSGKRSEDEQLSLTHHRPCATFPTSS